MNQRTKSKLLPVTSATLGLAAAGYVYSRYIEPNRIVVERINLPIAKLPSHLDGFTIAQLSDLHVLPHTKLPFIKRVVARTNALNPDLVALTGDYVCHKSSIMFQLAPELAKLRTRHGIYAVLGNHDIDRKFPETKSIVMHTLRARGIHVLCNQRVELDNGLVIAGLEEMYDELPDLPRTMQGVPQTTPVVLLMHQPDYADLACRDPRVIVQLSGHTHGGQIRLPGIQPLYLPYYGRKYVIGTHRIGNLWLHVNRGIGLAFFGPFRFRCPPEITLITLKQAQS